MWRLTIVALCGCSFHGASELVSVEAGAPADAMTDAPPDAPAELCAFAITGAVAAAPNVLGGNGGSPVADLTCLPGELPVGFAFDVTTGNPPGGWNQVAIAGLHVRCARIVDLTAGGLATQPMETLDRLPPNCAGNTTNSWATTAVAELDCPAGSALVGMSGNADTNGGTQSMFNTVAMRCAPLTTSGQLGTATTLAFPTTGHNTDHAEDVVCPPNTVIVTFGSRSACGQDQLAPRCGPIACQ